MVARKPGRRICLRVWIPVILLLGIGILFVYSASSGYSRNYVPRQAVWVCAGLALAIGFSCVHYREYRSAAAPLYILSLISLVIVLFFGDVRNNARSWLGIGSLGIQPSEFAKIAVIFIFGRYLADFEEHRYDIRYYLFSFLLLFLPLVCIILQPDLGTTLVFLPVVFAMFYVSGTRQSLLALTIFGGISMFPLLWQFLSDRQKQRILLTWSPEQDPFHFGYQAIQSKIAIGSGLFTGRGYMQSLQSRLNFLPERHTDFVFSVIGEEWGFLGSALVVLLYTALILGALSIARNAKDTFGEVVAVGIAVLIATHVFMNIGMTIVLLPIIGVPLPFLSYGGSSLFTFMIAVGILQSIYAHSLNR